MKITKEMGMACLRELESGEKTFLGDEALMQIGWLKDGVFEESGAAYKKHSDTALAMCAAIAGVKPEDVE